MNSRITTSILLSSLLVAGCKTRPKPEPPHPEKPKPAAQETTVTTVAVERITTLELDPAKPIDIGGWWDNGEVLLEIGYDYSYRIRQGASQESPVIERGRWTRGNHAEFHLEPYADGIVVPERVALSIENGVPTATVDDLAPFKKLARPPQIVGEELEGTWRGARGTIAFDSNGTFLLATREDEAHPIAGTWTIEHGALVLTPKDPAVTTLVLLLQRSRDGQLIRLQDVEGPLLPFNTP